MLPLKLYYSDNCCVSVVTLCTLLLVAEGFYIHEDSGNKKFEKSHWNTWLSDSFSFPKDYIWGRSQQRGCLRPSWEALEMSKARDTAKREGVPISPDTLLSEEVNFFDLKPPQAFFSVTVRRPSFYGVESKPRFFHVFSRDRRPTETVSDEEGHDEDTDDTTKLFVNKKTQCVQRRSSKKYCTCGNTNTCDTSILKQTSTPCSCIHSKTHEEEIRTSYSEKTPMKMQTKDTTEPSFHKETCLVKCVTRYITECETICGSNIQTEGTKQHRTHSAEHEESTTKYTTQVRILKECTCGSKEETSKSKSHSSETTCISTEDVTHLTASTKQPSSKHTRHSTESVKESTFPSTEDEHHSTTKKRSTISRLPAKKTTHRTEEKSDRKQTTKSITLDYDDEEDEAEITTAEPPIKPKHSTKRRKTTKSLEYEEVTLTGDDSEDEEEVDLNERVASPMLKEVTFRSNDDWIKDIGDSLNESENDENDMETTECTTKSPTCSTRKKSTFDLAALLGSSLNQSIFDFRHTLTKPTRRRLNRLTIDSLLLFGDNLKTTTQCTTNKWFRKIPTFSINVFTKVDKNDCTTGKFERTTHKKYKTTTPILNERDTYEEIMSNLTASNSMFGQRVYEAVRVVQIDLESKRESIRQIMVEHDLALKGMKSLKKVLKQCDKVEAQLVSQKRQYLKYLYDLLQIAKLQGNIYEKLENKYNDILNKVSGVIKI